MPFLQAIQEYADYISKRHTAFKSYRDATISKWSEKTHLASGKLKSKVQEQNEYKTNKQSNKQVVMTLFNQYLEIHRFKRGNNWSIQNWPQE